MCTVILRGGPACDEKLVQTVRRELEGVGTDPQYRLIDVAGRDRPGATAIGLVVGESSAYAVDLLRTPAQWRVHVSDLEVIVESPKPGATTALRTMIAFQAVGASPGSSYPGAELWIDGWHVDGNLAMVAEDDEGVDRIRWSRRAKVPPGRHVLVGGVRLWGEVAVRAWLFTAQ